MLDIAEHVSIDEISFEPYLPAKLINDFSRGASHGLISKCINSLSQMGGQVQTINALLDWHLQDQTILLNYEADCTWRYLQNYNRSQKSEYVKGLIDRKAHKLLQQLVQRGLPLDKININNFNLLDYVLLFQDGQFLEKFLINLNQNALVSELIKNSHAVYICVAHRNHHRLLYFINQKARLTAGLIYTHQWPEFFRTLPQQALELAFAQIDARSIKILLEFAERNEHALKELVALNPTVLELAIKRQHNEFLKKVIKLGFKLQHNIATLITWQQWLIIADSLFNSKGTHDGEVHIDEKIKDFPVEQLTFADHSLLDKLMLAKPTKPWVRLIVEQARTNGKLEILMKNAHPYYISVLNNSEDDLDYFYDLGYRTDNPFRVDGDNPPQTGFELAFNTNKIKLWPRLMTYSLSSPVGPLTLSPLDRAAARQDYHEFERLLYKGQHLNLIPAISFRPELKLRLDPIVMILFDVVHNLYINDVEIKSIGGGAFQEFLGNCQQGSLRQISPSYWMIRLQQLELFKSHYSVVTKTDNQGETNNRIVELDHLMNIFAKAKLEPAYFDIMRNKQRELLIGLHLSHVKNQTVKHRGSVFGFNYWSHYVGTNLKNYYPNFNKVLFAEGVVGAQNEYVKANMSGLESSIEHILNFTLQARFLFTNDSILDKMLANFLPQNVRSVLHGDDFKQYITHCKNWFSNHLKTTFASNESQCFVRSALAHQMRVLNFGLTHPQLTLLSDFINERQVTLSEAQEPIGTHIRRLYKSAVKSQLALDDVMLTSNADLMPILQQVLINTNQFHGLATSPQFQAYC